MSKKEPKIILPWNDPVDDTGRRCSTSSYIKKIYENYPEESKQLYIQKELESLERLKKVREARESDIFGLFSSQQTVYKVCCHVHVCLLNPGILSDAEIQAGIDKVNEDFRKTNADIPARWASRAADVGIELEWDPSTGRTDVSAPITGYPIGDEIKMSSQGGSDPVGGASTNESNTTVLNIWIGQIYNPANPNSILFGYASFPSWHPQNSTMGAPIQGVVINLQSWKKGTVAGGINGYDEGRTLTHELGHFFNLRHIWGDGDCQQDDYVTDTPRQGYDHTWCGSSTAGTDGCGAWRDPALGTLYCPGADPDTGVNSNSCMHENPDEYDMWENYMDYSADHCMGLFTQGQADRMRDCLENYRAPMISYCNATTTTTVAPTTTTTSTTTTTVAPNYKGYSLQLCANQGFSCSGVAPTGEVSNRKLSQDASTLIGVIDLNIGDVIKIAGVAHQCCYEVTQEIAFTGQGGYWDVDSNCNACSSGTTTTASGTTTTASGTTTTSCPSGWNGSSTGSGCGHNQTITLQHFYNAGITNFPTQTMIVNHIQGMVDTWIANNSISNDPCCWQWGYKRVTGQSWLIHHEVYMCPLCTGSCPQVCSPALRQGCHKRVYSGTRVCDGQQVTFCDNYGTTGEDCHGACEDTGNGDDCFECVKIGGQCIGNISVTNLDCDNADVIQDHWMGNSCNDMTGAGDDCECGGATTTTTAAPTTTTAAGTTTTAAGTTTTTAAGTTTTPDPCPCECCGANNCYSQTWTPGLGGWGNSACYPPGQCPPQAQPVKKWLNSNEGINAGDILYAHGAGSVPGCALEEAQQSVTTYKVIDSNDPFWNHPIQSPPITSHKGTDSAYGDYVWISTDTAPEYASFYPCLCLVSPVFPCDPCYRTATTTTTTVAPTTTTTGTTPTPLVQNGCPDLDLYVKVGNDPTVWWDNMNEGAMSLNVDAHPDCEAAPPSPEIATGSYTEDKTFKVWYNQYSDCAPQVNPADLTKTAKFTNTGQTGCITVNGQEVPPGGVITFNWNAFAGFNTAEQDDYAGGNEFIVLCCDPPVVVTTTSTTTTAPPGDCCLRCDTDAGSYYISANSSDQGIEAGDPCTFNWSVPIETYIDLCQQNNPNPADAAFDAALVSQSNCSGEPTNRCCVDVSGFTGSDSQYNGTYINEVLPCYHATNPWPYPAVFNLMNHDGTVNGAIKLESLDIGVKKYWAITNGNYVAASIDYMPFFPVTSPIFPFPVGLNMCLGANFGAAANCPNNGPISVTANANCTNSTGDPDPSCPSGYDYFRLETCWPEEGCTYYTKECKDNHSVGCLNNQACNHGLVTIPGGDTVCASAYPISEATYNASGSTWVDTTGDWTFYNCLWSGWNISDCCDYTSVTCMPGQTAGACQNDADDSCCGEEGVNAWDSVTSYSVGAVVCYQGTSFVSLTNNNLNNPPIDTNDRLDDTNWRHAEAEDCPQ